MIPLATPRTGEIINLLTVSRVKQLDDGQVRVVYTDGKQEIFQGEQAGFIMGELVFALQEYRAYQKAVTDAANGPPLIHTPTNERIN